MSYDLEIAIQLKPEQVHLDEFLASRKDVVQDGKFGVELHSAILRLNPGTPSEAFVEVSAPSRVFEPGDLDEGLAAAVPDAEWLMQMGVPGFDREGVKLALALAQHFAERCQGAVLDPQVGRVVWPPASAQKPQAPPSRERIRCIMLAWYFTPSRLSPREAPLFLATLRRTFPEAVPTRFGKYEPLQGKLEPGDDGPFVEAWSSTETDVLGDLTVKCKRPCFGGSIFLTKRGPSRRGEAKARRIKLDFDGRTIEADEHRLEALVNLFVELSRSMGAFFAHGYVVRGVVGGRGGIGFDSKTEQYPVPNGWWWGIPPTPTWLAWFGQPYRSLVEPALQRPEATAFDEGVLLRLGQQPADYDNVKDVALRLPANLLAGMQKSTTTLPNGKQASTWGWQAKPAEFIPPLE